MSLRRILLAALGLATAACGVLGLLDAPPGSVAYTAIAGTLMLLTIPLL